MPLGLAQIAASIVECSAGVLVTLEPLPFANAEGPLQLLTPTHPPAHHTEAHAHQAEAQAVNAPASSGHSPAKHPAAPGTLSLASLLRIAALPLLQPVLHCTTANMFVMTHRYSAVDERLPCAIWPCLQTVAHDMVSLEAAAGVCDAVAAIKSTVCVIQLHVWQCCDNATRLWLQICGSVVDWYGSSMLSMLHSYGNE